MNTSDLLWQDTQHQELFQMMDELKRSTKVDLSLLERLSDYVQRHFSLEEKYMQACEFPQEKAEIHIRAHRMFEHKITSISQSQNIVSQGLKNDRFRQELAEFLEHWLKAHVMGLDKDLESHVMESRIK